MDEDEARGVFAALAIASMLAVVMVIVQGWDHIRCYLPSLPVVRVNDDRSPTLTVPEGK